MDRVPAVPDGVAIVRHKDHEHTLIVEIDMATVRLERMRDRYRAYWTWSRRGNAHRKYGYRPLRVLTLTTTPRRLAALRNAAVDAPQNDTKGSGTFWFATLDDAADIKDPDKLLGPVWTVSRVEPGKPERLFSNSK